VPADAHRPKPARPRRSWLTEHELIELLRLRLM